MSSSLDGEMYTCKNCGEMIIDNYPCSSCGKAPDGDEETYIPHPWNIYPYQ